MKSGYLPEDSIKKIQEAGIIGMYRKTDDIIVNKKRNVCDYITIERCYKQNGDYTISVVMVFCHRDYTDGQAELFKILTDYIKLLVEQQYFEKLNFFPAESLITDLLNNTTDNIHIIKQRASYVNIPFESTFQLLLISFSDYTNIPERQVISKFSDLLFPAKVIPYQHQIVILTSYNDEILPSSKNDKNILKIQPLVNEYDAFCGISNSFSFLYEIPVAYKQAKIVVPLGKKIENNHGIFCSGRNMDRIYKFEDYYIHIILDTCLKENTDLLSKSFSVDTLKALQEHDSVHNTEYFKILYHFLTNERRASDASKGLNMHRNTVVYHIEKISELFHLNLDNSDDRLKLLLGYKILEINSTPYFSPPFLNTTETQTGNFM